MDILTPPSHSPDITLALYHPRRYHEPDPHIRSYPPTLHLDRLLSSLSSTQRGRRPRPAVRRHGQPRGQGQCSHQEPKADMYAKFDNYWKCSTSTCFNYTQTSVYKQPVGYSPPCPVLILALLARSCKSDSNGVLGRLKGKIPVPRWLLVHTG